MSAVLIDLGCGRRKMPGYIGVDCYPLPGVDIVHDCSKGLPFDDNSVDIVRAYDFIEHIPQSSNILREIWRILKHEGVVDIMVPSTDGRGAFQDPTHVSFWNENSFEYYTKIEKIQRMGHYYSPGCLFEVRTLYTTPFLRDQICWVHAVLIADKKTPLPPQETECLTADAS